MNIAKWISKLGNNATSYELLPKDESSETTNPRRQSARGFKRYAYVGIALAILLGSVYLYMSPVSKAKLQHSVPQTMRETQTHIFIT